MPLLSRTRATLRSAELGFFGVVVYTRVHTPRRWGAATRRLRALADFRPGVATFFLGVLRPLRTSCEVVGMRGGMLAGRFAPAGARSGDPDRRHAGAAVESVDGGPNGGAAGAGGLPA